ncbi:two-component system regulatory protein YycI [Methanogenium cariaci]
MAKKSTPILLLLAALVIIVIVSIYLSSVYLSGGIPGSANVGSPVIVSTGSGTVYRISAPMPTVNETYPVYRTVTPVVTENYVRKIAKNFSLEGEVSTMGSGILLIKDTAKEPEERVEVFQNSGGFRYTIPDKMFPTVDHQPNLPSDDEAKVIAETYCSGRGLLSEGECFDNVSVCFRQGAWDAGKEISSYNVTLAAQCRQTIDDLPTVGGTTTVYIGEAGEVVGVTKTSREREENPVRYSSIISPEQAIEELAAGTDVITPLGGNYDNVTITNISLAYWIEPLASSQEYVYPVYVFSGTAEGKGESYPVSRYLWAIPSAKR